MREYTIKIEEHERNLTSSADEPTTELGLVLQIYQDLKRLDSKEEEDVLILNILSQILLEHFINEDLIPVPKEYKDGKEDVTNYYE